MIAGNLFSSIPPALETEHFETLAQGRGVTIERIVSSGHTSPESGWYDQDHREWVIVLRGNAVLEYASGERIELDVGAYVDIAAHVRHRVIHTSSAPPTVWLAVHFPAEPGDPHHR